MTGPGVTGAAAFDGKVILVGGQTIDCVLIEDPQEPQPGQLPVFWVEPARELADGEQVAAIDMRVRADPSAFRLQVRWPGDTDSYRPPLHCVVQDMASGQIVTDQIL